MEILIIIACIAGGTILLLTELFLVPGISVAGLLSGGCFVYANYYAFACLGVGGGIVTLLISLAACAISIVWFMRSKTLDKLALTQDIGSQIDRSAEEGVKVGDTGTATTRLALIGYADMGGKMVEVKSEDGFLDEKTPLIVSSIVDGVILVKKQQDPTQ